MTNTAVINWPGVRETKDGKFSLTLNVSNTLYIESGFYDAESAAIALDATKFNLVESGHLRRSNFYFFPEIVATWNSGERVNPQPHSDLLKFMAANKPRYVPVKQRASASPMPTNIKIFVAQQTLRKILSASPSRLNDAERSAFQTVLASITAFLIP